MANNQYQKHKDRIQKEASERNQNLSEEKSKKNEKKTFERYQNLTEEEEKKLQYHRKCNKNVIKRKKKKLVDYRRNYYIPQNK